MKSIKILMVCVLLSLSFSIKAEDQVKTVEPIVIEVYRSPSCGCCSKWIAHLKENQFDVKDHVTNDVQVIKDKYGVPEKNFERFRADVIILCGYYDNVVRLDGSVRIEPRSVSFANMTEETFSELYNKTINVLLKHVYDSNMTAEALDNVVDAYMSFA